MTACLIGATPRRARRVVDPDLWAAAHAQMTTTRQVFLRAADGSGRMVGHAEAIVNRYLLSGLLACGAHSDATGRKPSAAHPLIATTRGRKQVPSYICAGHRDKGKTFCTNQTGVPMAQLHGRPGPSPGAATPRGGSRPGGQLGAPSKQTQDRGAARLRRGATNVWGAGGHLGPQ